VFTNVALWGKSVPFQAVVMMSPWWTLMACGKNFSNAQGSPGVGWPSTTTV
jgi:hypothetical protein